MRFRSYFSLALAFTALVPFLAISWLEKTDNDRTIALADQQQKEEASLAGLLLNERLSFITNIATFAKDELQSYTAQSDPRTLERSLAQIVSAFPLLTNLHVDYLNAGGEAHVLAFHSKNPDEEAANPRGTDHSARWHAAAARSRERELVHYSPVILSAQDKNTPLITFTVTGVKGDYLVSGALVFNRLFADIRTSLLQRGLDLTVVDASRQIIYPLSKTTSVEKWTAPLREGTITVRDQTYFATVSQLKSLQAGLPDWTLIVTRPESARLSEQSTLMMRTTGFALLILLLTSVVGWIFARPLQKAFSKLDRDLDERYFGSELTTVSRGPAELEHYQSEYRRVRRELNLHVEELTRLNAHLTDLVEERSRALLAQERLFKEVFDVMADAVLLLSTEWAVLHANASAEKLVSDTLLEQIRLSVQEGEPLSRHTRRLTVQYGGSGAGKTFEASCFLFTSSRPDLTEGICLIVRDITERAQLEQMKADLIGIVAHELKTPITTCRLALSTIEEQMGVTDSSRLMHDDLDHLQRIVTDWLNVVQIDAGTFTVHPDYMQLLPTVNRAVHLVRTRHDFDITVEVSEEAEIVLADRRAIIEVLVNLFTNACRYARPGELPHIELNAFRVRDKLHIECLDAGIGIPEEERERIFDRFYQVNRGTKRLNGGTGLGLVIARAICQAHGGSIAASDRNGKTLFTIVLPQPLVPAAPTA